MHFPNSSAGSPVGNTRITSGEDEEGFQVNLHRNAFTKLMMTAGTRRKRFAESDRDDLSVSTKPATKRRAVMNAVYVDIPVWSANVPVSVVSP